MKNANTTEHVRKRLFIRGKEQTPQRANTTEHVRVSVKCSGKTQKSAETSQKGQFVRRIVSDGGGEHLGYGLQPYTPNDVRSTPNVTPASVHRFARPVRRLPRPDRKLADQLDALAHRIRCLGPDHRNPQRFHEDKSEIAHELAKLAEKVA